MCQVSGAMKRSILACSFVLGLSALAFGASASAASVSARAQSHSKAVTCTSAAKSHTKVTKGDVSACEAISSKHEGHCPGGSTVVVVKVNKQSYALRQGHKAVKVGNVSNFNHLLGTLCGSFNTNTTPTVAPPTTGVPTTTMTIPRL